MDSWMFDGTPREDDGSGPAAGVIVATEEALPIRLERLPPDPSIGAGLVVLGSYLGTRLVARCAVPPAAAAMIEERGLLRDPVRIALAAREAPPGLQCQLFALVTVPADLSVEEAPEDPWASSLPGASYERAVSEAEPEPGPGEAAQAAVLLGQVVRFTRDRRHPGSLPDEAVDVLSAIVQGELVEVVDKLLDDLLE
jgi:hypothetical protein